MPKKDNKVDLGILDAAVKKVLAYQPKKRHQGQPSTPHTSTASQPKT